VNILATGGSAVPIIDIHNHFYPPAYLEELASHPGNVQVTRDRERNPLLHYPGDYNIAVRGHRVDARALGLAMEFAGANRLLAGSDYPHQIGSIPQMLENIGALRPTAADGQAILGGNATRLLGL
jgi:hypothetical protein